jgi:hypothetical protein
VEIMRHCWGVVLALLAGLLAGCRGTQPGATTTRFSAPGSFAEPAGADVVQLNLFVIERPAGDDFLNRKLWEMTDEQAVCLEGNAGADDDGFRVRQNLEDNGFRVGQVGGVLPSELQGLLASDIACPDPRHVFLHSAHVLPVSLGPVLSRCRLQVFKDGRPSSGEFKDAQCRLDIVPQLTGDGRVRLEFTPHIRHGARAIHFAPCQDPGGALRWDRQEEAPDEAFAQASWHLTIAPNEYVIVGTHLNRPGTLGHACFLGNTEDGRPMQRLLVLKE